MAGTNEMGSVEGQLVGLPLAGPETFTVQQLAYLKRALGVDETVLWSGDFKYGDANITLPETIANFDRILLVSGSTHMIHYRKAANGSFTLINAVTSSDAKQKVAYATFSISGATVSYLRNRVMQGDTAYSNVSDGETHITQIVGIHRIAGGN